MSSEGTEQRKLLAIMFTDMVGYSALAQKNEALALRLLDEHRQLLRPIFPRHNGQEIKTIGDAFLVAFTSALDAVRCAVEMQKVLTEYNFSSPETIKIQIRIGLHVGDVVHRDNDVFGDGVNIAARIEPLAGPGGICLTQQVFDHVHNKVEEPLIKLGAGELKNISIPVSVYRVVLPWEANPLPLFEQIMFLLRKKRTRFVLALVMLVMVGAVLWQLGHHSASHAKSESMRRREAQDLVDLGNLFAAKGDITNLNEAIKNLTNAINIDPESAEAHVTLASAYNALETMLEPNRGWDAKAFEEVRKALRLNPELPAALQLRAEIYFTPLNSWDYKSAIKDLRQLIRLNPNLARPHQTLSFVLLHIGLLEESLSEMDIAVRMNPSLSGLKAQTLLYQGKYEEALREFDMPFSKLWAAKFRGGFGGMCLYYLGRTSDVSEMLDSLLKAEPNEPLMTSLQAIILAAGGKANEAKEKISIARKGERDFIHFHHATYQIGAAHALMRENKLALEFLRKAADNGFPCYPYFTNDPNLKNLKEDTGFKRFLEEQEQNWKKRKAEYATNGP